MDNTWIYLYDQHSEAGNELAEALDVRKIRHTNSTFRGDPGKVVINWGSGELPRQVRNCRVINSEDAVSKSINKLAFFRATYGRVATVPWTTSREQAAMWLVDGHKVVVRNRLEGREGQGVVIIEPETR